MGAGIAMNKIPSTNAVGGLSWSDIKKRDSDNTKKDYMVFFLFASPVVVMFLAWLAITLFKGG